MNPLFMRYTLLLLLLFPALFAVGQSVPGAPTFAASTATVNNASPCAGTNGVSITYTVNPDGAASSYEWTLAGYGALTPSTTRSATIFFSATGAPGTSAMSGNILVAAKNSSGVKGPISTFPFTIYFNPGNASGISGTQTVMQGQKGVAFSTPAISPAFQYNWNLPSGGTIATGANTPNITVDFSCSASSGQAMVFAVDGSCGTGGSSTYAVNVTPVTAPPATVGAISGPANSCLGSTASYNVTPVTGAQTYTWTVPTGATVQSGANTSSISVLFSSTTTITNGTISVYATNCKGNSNTSSTQITTWHPVQSPPGPITGPGSLCVGQNATYVTPAFPYANTYNWNIPAAINSGQGTTSVNITSSYEIISPGMTVTASNPGCSSSISTGGSYNAFNYAGATGTITPSATIICTPQNSVTYTVTPLNDPYLSGYVWSIPPSASGSSSTNTITVNYPTGSTNGNVSVYATRGPGCTGTGSTLPVTIGQTPQTPTGTNGTGCGSSTVTLTATPGSGGSQVRWYANMIDPIPAYVGNSYQTPPLSMTKTYFASTYNPTTQCESGRVSVTAIIIGGFANLNYVATSNILTSNIKNITDAIFLPVDQKNTNVTYLDGLGRPIQSIGIQNSPGKSDVIQPIVYDQIGREYRKYLPYTDGCGGFYRTGILDANNNYTGVAQTFYSTTSDAVADDTRPFSETKFEPSPLNRPLKNYGSGYVWSDQGANKFVEHQYLLNIHSTGVSASQEAIISWSLDGSSIPVRSAQVAGYVLAGGYYESGQLSVNVTLDENQQIVREYTNKLGQVILKKVQAGGDGSNLNSVTDWALTYYVYDDFGHLVVVLPPEAVKTLTN